jgi:hypothetical protein
VKALVKRPQGSRPVTLVGHSIGARLIFSCLIELARIREEELKNKKSSVDPEKHQERQSVRSIEDDEDNDNWRAMASGQKIEITDIADGKAGEGDIMIDEEPKSTFGIIQDVILLGIPVNTSVSST